MGWVKGCRERVWRECELRVLGGVLRGGVSVTCVVYCVVVWCLLGYVCGGWIWWRGLLEGICDLYWFVGVNGERMVMVDRRGCDWGVWLEWVGDSG